MPTKLRRTDGVVIGLGWSGAILANELTDEGLDVVALERGPWRDTARDLSINFVPDEMRYGIRLDLVLRPAQQTLRCATMPARRPCRLHRQGGGDRQEHGRKPDCCEAA